MQRQSKGFTARLPIPRDLPIGSVVGQRGCNVRLVEAKNGVRCVVDSKKREAQLCGTRDGVDKAIDGLQDLFHRLRIDYINRQAKLRKEQARLPLYDNLLYRHAALVDKTHGSWLFQRRYVADAKSGSFENCLVRLETFGADDEDDEDGNDAAVQSQKKPWITEFDDAFQERMVRDVTAIENSTKSTRKVKIKAALGVTLYSLPDPRTACRLYTWEQLKTLTMPTDLKARWKNDVNMSSNTIALLMKHLEGTITKATTFHTFLTVYIGLDGQKKDFSIKFRWTAGRWEPVIRPPARVAHALYNIALDDETAFRVRVYSRESPVYAARAAALWDQLNIIYHASGDPLRTEVKPTRDFPDDMFIRKIWVREKTQIDHRGLSFSLSYMDAAREKAILQCHVLCQPSEEDNPSPLSDVMRQLLQRLVPLVEPNRE